MQKAGWVLLIAGSGVVVGYWAYYVLAAIFESAPGPLLVGIVGIVAGLAFLFASTVRDRLRQQKDERFEEMKR